MRRLSLRWDEVSFRSIQRLADFAQRLVMRRASKNAGASEDADTPAGLARPDRGEPARPEGARHA